MNEDIKNILREYSIGDIVKIKPINKGSISNAIYILSDKGKWVLRKLKNRDQGITEHIISNTLVNDCICPQIVATKSNTGYSNYEGNYYNLQVYIQPQPIESNLETFEKLGRALGLLHSKLENNIGLIEQEDRFSLEDLWKQAKNKWNNVQKQLDFLLFNTNDFEGLIDEMITYQNTKKVFIHGDLSKRNLIYSSEKAYIIDFGEIRKGDNHLDIAATLTSMVNFEQGEEYVYKCLYAFYENYTSYMKDFQWENLQKNIQLWIIRGILALLLYTSNTSAFVEKSKKIIDLESNLSKVILDNFI